MSKKKIGLVLGPLAFCSIYFILPIQGLSHAGLGVLASAVWISIWWVFEAVPLAVTALLPIVLFPILGSMPISETTSSYGHKFIFLFTGGFMLSIAIEKWNLHKRIALNIIALIGTKPEQIIFGFMAATAFLSMWISNTATTVMLLPVALAVYKEYNSKEFGTPLMLSIAYSASIGGMATLIGTPPNLILAGVIQDSYGIELSFSKWFSFGFPISIALLTIAWFYLCRFAYPLKSIKTNVENLNSIEKQLKDLGKMSREEKYILVIFTLAALSWICRSFVLQKIIPGIDDTIIAISAAILLFIIPGKSKKTRLLEWEDLKSLPWGILLLFGGGLALAKGFQYTDLATWIGAQVTGIDGLILLVQILISIAVVNFLTEITSNMAITAMLLPIMVSVSASLNLNPYTLLVSTTVAASCAFMLPTATGPNAIVFSSGTIKMEDMVRKGFFMNLISILILTLFTYYLVPIIWSKVN